MFTVPDTQTAASAGLTVLALFAARYLLGLLLRALSQRTKSPTALHEQLNSVYQERVKLHAPLPDPNESIELAKELKLGLEEVNTWFRTKSQFDREQVRTRRMIESLWLFIIYTTSAVVVAQDNQKFRVALYLHLITLHVVSGSRGMPASEFVFVLGEFIARTVVFAVAPVQFGNALAVTHCSVDALFEFTRLVGLSRFRKASRGLFVMFAIAWFAVKLAWFGKQVQQAQPDQEVTLVAVGLVVLFDLANTITVLTTLRDAFWSIDESTGVQKARRDSDLSSAGYSSSHEYDSDSSISSQLKHY